MATTCGGSHIALQSIVIILWRKVCRLHAEYDSRAKQSLKFTLKEGFAIADLNSRIVLITSKKPSKKYNEQSVMKISKTTWQPYVMNAY